VLIESLGDEAMVDSRYFGNMKLSTDRPSAHRRILTNIAPAHSYLRMIAMSTLALRETRARGDAVTGE